jgi:molecular chaperone GrpE
MTAKKEGKEVKSQNEGVKKETHKDESVESLAKIEVKRLEGKEPGKLEYFSKDELIQNLAKLEAELKTLKEKHDKVEEEKNSWKNKYTRLQAEFENAEKRWNKNRQNLRVEYTASTIKTLLPLYDSFKKALDHQDENNAVLKGFYDQFMNILKSHKAHPINVKVNDPFDYNYHEALSSIEKEDIPENTILDIIQDGWKLDNEVIRYTKVIISKKPKAPEAEPVKHEQAENDKNMVSENSEKLDAENEDENKRDKKDLKSENEYIS